MNAIKIAPETRSPQESVAGRVLVVDDHRSARESMLEILRHAGHDVTGLSSAVEALKYLDAHSVDVIITDLQMPGMSGLELIRQLQGRRHGAQVAMITAHASVQTAVEAIRHGAFDYIEKPFTADQLESLVARAIERGCLLDRRQPLSSNTPESSAAPAMIGNSPAMQQLRERICLAAPTDETILITGESGTGKELIARTVHALSLRVKQPLVSLNCPVLSAQLMESELFGHERGAFTGAESARTGRFEMADRGTILLDEVSEIEPPLQAKLLRVLQERAFERVGASRTIEVDVRVLATTNRTLSDEVAAGRFREDLFYRLAVIPLYAPPLRQRAGDVPLLVDFFLQRAAQRLHRDPCTLSSGALDLLQSHHWPGNVRELENIISRASVLHGSSRVEADALRPWLIGQNELASPHDNSTPSDTTLPVGVSLQEMERRLIQSTLDHFDGHRARTAEALGIGLRTLSGKLREYGYAPRAKTMARSA